jgi:hypothetical protein
LILNLAFFFLLVSLGFVLYQDIKDRAIHIGLPILIFAIGIVINYNMAHLSFIGFLYNIGFIAINMIGLVGYYSLKSKSLVNPIDKFIGLGDLMFFMAITPLFNLKPFILFFISGLLFSLIIHAIVTIFKKTKTIPLAGYLSLFLMLYVITKDVLKMNFL